MKNNEKTLFILGPKSPMIDNIEEVLREVSLNYVYGFSNCERTTISTKHSVTSVSDVDVKIGIDTVVCIDCVLSKSAIDRWYQGYDIINVIGDESDNSDKDHLHYWKNSVLGKVYTKIGKHPNKQARMLAAGDYCLKQAYDGLCISIDPEEFKIHRIEELSKQLTIPVIIITDMLEEARKQIISSSTKIIEGREFKDLRSVDIPLMNEAIHMVDKPALMVRYDLKSGNKYNCICGSSIDDITAWYNHFKHVLVCIKKNYYSLTAEGVKL